MFWNYRVANNENEESFYFIEVYYNEPDKIIGYCKAQPFGNTLEELKNDLNGMYLALDRNPLIIRNGEISPS